MSSSDNIKLSQMQLRKISDNMLYSFFPDVLLTLGLSVLIGLITYFNAGRIDSFFYDNRHQMDVWFQSDLPERFLVLTDHTYVTIVYKIHLLFAPLGFIPVTILRDLLGINTMQACHIILAFVAAFWVICLFLTLRILGLARLDSSLFSAMGIFSAASIFWFPIPESFPFGSLGIILALMIIARSELKPVTTRWYVLLGAFNMGTTLTNAMVIFFALLAKFPISKALLILSLSLILWGFLGILVILHVSPYFYFLLAIITALFIRKFGNSLGRHWQTLTNSYQRRWSILGLFFAFCLSLLVISSKLRSLIAAEIVQQLRFMLLDESGRFFPVFQSFFSHTMIMPEIQVVLSTWFPESGVKILLTQFSEPGSGSFWGALGVGLWISLLALGIFGFFSTQKYRDFKIVLGGSLIAQLLMHLFYGEETFLYSLHFLPFLIIMAAWSTFTRLRIAALVLAGLLVVTISINNLQQYQAAMDILAERQIEHSTLFPNSSLSTED